MYKKFIIGAILSIASTHCQALYDAYVQHNTDINNIDNDWIDLGAVNIPKYGPWVGGDGVPGGLTKCSGTGGNIQLCNDLRADTWRNLPAYWRPDLELKYVEKDINGKIFTFALAFPTPPILHNYDFYPGSYWVDNTISNKELDFSTVSKEHHPPQHPSQYSQYNRFIRGPEQYTSSCPFDTCVLYQLGWFRMNSPDPHLYVKLPKNLTAGEIINFENMHLMTFNLNHKSNQDWYTDPRLYSKLFVSAKLIMPQQKCYISAVGGNTVDFNSINSTAANGLVATKYPEIKSRCVLPKAGTKQYIKIQPVSGGQLSQDEYSYRFNNDKDGVPALGFTIGKIGDIFTPSCNETPYNNAKFNEEYLVRKFVGNNQEEQYTDTIKISLCKYGIPATTFGRQTLGIKIVSRWE